MQKLKALQRVAIYFLYAFAYGLPSSQRTISSRLQLLEAGPNLGAESLL